MFMQTLVRMLVYAAAALFVVSLIFAQQACSIFPSFGHQCNGPEGDAWMLPFILAPIGLPAMIAALVFMIRGDG
jgi:hypothetical protein